MRDLPGEGRAARGAAVAGRTAPSGDGRRRRDQPGGLRRRAVSQHNVAPASAGEIGRPKGRPICLCATSALDALVTPRFARSKADERSSRRRTSRPWCSRRWKTCSARKRKRKTHCPSPISTTSSKPHSMFQKRSGGLQAARFVSALHPTARLVSRSCVGHAERSPPQFVMMEKNPCGLKRRLLQFQTSVQITSRKATFPIEQSPEVTQSFLLLHDRSCCRSVTGLPTAGRSRSVSSRRKTSDQGSVHCRS